MMLDAIVPPSLPLSVPGTLPLCGGQGENKWHGVLGDGPNQQQQPIMLMKSES